MESVGLARRRIYGSDVPFCDWLRKNEGLPAKSRDCGFVVTDVDVLIHRYFTGLEDGCGTRDVQSQMWIEVKTRGGLPEQSQCDTLLKEHLAVCQNRNGTLSRKTICWNGQVIVNYGVSVLQLSHTTPDDSETMNWFRFRRTTGDNYALDCVREINRDELLQILRFEIHPDSLTPTPFRRHHKTRHIIQQEHMPLGFTAERQVTIRS